MAWYIYFFILKVNTRICKNGQISGLVHLRETYSYYSHYRLRHTSIYSEHDLHSHQNVGWRYSESADWLRHWSLSTLHTLFISGHLTDTAINKAMEKGRYSYNTHLSYTHSRHRWQRSHAILLLCKHTLHTPHPEGPVLTESRVDPESICSFVYGGSGDCITSINSLLSLVSTRHLKYTLTHSTWLLVTCVVFQSTGNWVFFVCFFACMFWAPLGPQGIGLERHVK